ncbi:hypothetical protein TRFO_22155 [Tritrichomonas foetus]|uniref:Uncharacterized protein n=1 Tax=Tritrichomonas foetus TaxID=1144522 RepID=A0A1J4KDS2_9EUKA|nr:hypothetical protein TRFO_22155 [Tritrichomonas foetus]|eukprot:OHT09138.1 hypothetical protein TRFO_22155 [Tritrichomonas foetus]
MCVKFLLEFKADPDIFDKDGYAPIHAAVERGSADLVELLLEFDAKPDQFQPIRNSIRQLPVQHWTPLHIAAQNNYPDILKMLLEKGASPNLPNNTRVTPLHIAAQQKAIEPLDLLLEYDADTMLVDDDDEPPLFLAIESRLPTHVAKLCNDQTIIDQNIKGETALHIAAKLGFHEIISYLLEQGANVYACDNKGNTPLHFAVVNKHKDCVKILLDAKADMLSRNENHESPFVLSTGEISALMKYYLEKYKETIRAEPVDKTPRSTRTVPSRLRSQMSPSQMEKTTNLQSPSRLQDRRTPSVVSASHSKSSKLKKAQVLTVRVYEEQIEKQIEDMHDLMKSQLDELRTMVRLLNEDMDNSKGQ